MPTTQIVRYENYEVDDQGVSTLVEVIETEVEVPTQEELIAEKEAKLLEMYAELQALKQNNTNV